MSKCMNKRCMHVTECPFHRVPNPLNYCEDYIYRVNKVDNITLKEGDEVINILNGIEGIVEDNDSESFGIAVDYHPLPRVMYTNGGKLLPSSIIPSVVKKGSKLIVECGNERAEYIIN